MLDRGNNALMPVVSHSYRSKALKVLSIPYWVFHHQNDEYNPVAGSRAMTKALKDAGAKNVKYTEYTYKYMGGGNPPGCFYHCGSFDKAYSEEAELLPWLFSWRRQ